MTLVCSQYFLFRCRCSLDKHVSNVIRRRCRECSGEVVASCWTRSGEDPAGDHSARWGNTHIVLLWSHVLMLWFLLYPVSTYFFIKADFASLIWTLSCLFHIAASDCQVGSRIWLITLSHDVTMKSPWRHHVITMSSPRRHHVAAG